MGGGGREGEIDNGRYGEEGHGGWGGGKRYR